MIKTDVKLWSCHICHKKNSPDFQIFILGLGYIELWSCQIFHKNFHQISNFSFLGGGADIV